MIMFLFFLDGLSLLVELMENHLALIRVVVDFLFGHLSFLLFLCSFIRVLRFYVELNDWHYSAFPNWFQVFMLYSLVSKLLHMLP